MQAKSPSSLKILVIQTAFLGDIVLSSSFLRALRDLFPKAQITLLTTASGISIFSPNPWDIELQLFDKRGADSGPLGLWRKALFFRRQKFDFVFCLHRSFRSSLLTKLIGAQKSFGFREASLAFLYDKKSSRQDFSYEAEKNLGLLKMVIQKDFSPYPELAISAKDEAEADELLQPLEGKAFVALSPSSVWATKRWPPEYFSDLALRIWQKHQLPTVFVGGSAREDYESCNRAFDFFNQGNHQAPNAVHNLVGKTNLGSIKAVLARAKIVVANDSAPLHIAIAVGTPVVGIFGPTTKELGFFPLAPAGKAKVAEVLELECRPCGAHGHQECPLHHFRCMVNLGVDQVEHAVEDLLCRY